MDHFTSSAFAQAELHSEQFSQGELRRVLDHLDDEAVPSADLRRFRGASASGKTIA
ncbi:hypothetical protein [Bradyrhizobium sp. CCBAU 51765]|uniref:hypothetical protein n=1 Tax=Bradyrhizobium sp. CCBAU 51765 TaxID=1325102 RepID=UPI001886CE70|nr:hypothetical protein [Bradyrhizobium sp. CCBAU 51765]